MTLGWNFLLFINFNMLVFSFFFFCWMVLYWRSGMTMFFPLYLRFWFSLTALRILSLSLWCLPLFLLCVLVVILVLTCVSLFSSYSFCLLDLCSCFFSEVMKFSTNFSSFPCSSLLPSTWQTWGCVGWVAWKNQALARSGLHIWNSVMNNFVNHNALNKN